MTKQIPREDVERVAAVAKWLRRFREETVLLYSDLDDWARNLLATVDRAPAPPPGDEPTRVDDGDRFKCPECRCPTDCVCCEPGKCRCEWTPGPFDKAQREPAPTPPQSIDQEARGDGGLAFEFVGWLEEKSVMAAKERDNHTDQQRIDYCDGQAVAWFQAAKRLAQLLGAQEPASTGSGGEDA